MRKNFLLAGALLSALVLCAGCFEDEHSGKIRNIFTIAKLPPIEGEIGIIPLSYVYANKPTGLSFIPEEQALLVTAEGNPSAELGEIWLAAKRESSFVIRTILATTANYGKFTGNIYDKNINRLYVCANPKNKQKGVPKVLAFSRLGSNRFFQVGSMSLNHNQAGKTCANLVLINDYLFATNSTPTAPTDIAIFYADVSGNLPTKMDPLQTYADLGYKAAQIQPNVPMLTDLKPKVEQTKEQFGMWVLSDGTKRIIGLEFGLIGATMTRVENPKLMQPGGSATSKKLLQAMIPYTDKLFLLIDRNTLYKSFFDDNGKLVKSSRIAPLASGSSAMVLGEDRFNKTSLPVLFYLSSPAGLKYSNVIEYAFNPNNT
ncbi:MULTISPECIES: hypothetical protein [Candidatus Ichthyocystis]|uniref:hypothetical protein n=3 Tax=Burkholderiales genera incertae sedis TaxID=224471 RepID=UPI000B862F5A|nr:MULTISPECIES: hypothetical protein [Ichthyocystis]